ncbi:hypothetical protein [Ferrimonas futtsuensis]|uniref:hypothetical protein n=1 Tax=Ferrimonas futtsuensis TaxID=364764 RepID=UPI000401800A|nr:hypothetical protein [Ferrimonas futtsuensis]
MKRKLGQTLLGASVIALGMLGVYQTFDSTQGEVSQSAQVMETLILGDEAKPQLSLNLEIYSGECRWIYGMYHSALGHQGSQRQMALIEVVEAALEADDFNMALLAAQQIESERMRSQLLRQVVERAIEVASHMDYAAQAVTMIPTPSLQEAAMTRLVEAYVEALYRSGGKRPGEKVEL